MDFDNASGVTNRNSFRSAKLSNKLKLALVCRFRLYFIFCWQTRAERAACGELCVANSLSLVRRRNLILYVSVDDRLVETKNCASLFSQKEEKAVPAVVVVVVAALVLVVVVVVVIVVAVVVETDIFQPV